MSGAGGGKLRGVPAFAGVLVLWGVAMWTPVRIGAEGTGSGEVPIFCDEANRLTRESTATSSGDALVKKYTLDDDGKPTAVTDELNTTETVAYDAFERPQAIIHPDLSVTTYGYTDRDEVATMSISDPQGGVLRSVGGY